MRRFLCLLLVLPAFSSDSLQLRAEKIAQKYLIIDTHIDAPYRQRLRGEDISAESPANFDYPKAKRGGLYAAFMSIYTPSSSEQEGTSKTIADELIDLVESWASAHPDKFAIATSVDQVEQHFRNGLIALPLGMENGSPIEGDLANLQHFYRRGIRYITLAHALSNHLADSSYDENRPWSGLSDFGKKVLGEMNRLGIMIDVSHLSDEAFYQIIELSSAPVLATHSSLRHFTPGFERNMSDDMVKALGNKGGVVMINFGSTFLSETTRQFRIEERDKIDQFRQSHDLEHRSAEVLEYQKELRQETPFPFATVATVADHIDRVVDLAGIDHVGLGSDFDGVGDSLPVGLKDASGYPNLIAELLRRNYSEEDIAKILSGNLLRVWRAVEQAAAGE